MATSYIISVGYNSAADREEVGVKLREVVAAIQSAPGRIVQEVRRIEPNISDDVIDYAESYRPPVEDLTVRIEEDDDGPCVRQCASGGGNGRDLKEACRRAFARLVIEEMHRERMEVCFNVC